MNRNLIYKTLLELGLNFRWVHKYNTRIQSFIIPHEWCDGLFEWNNGSCVYGFKHIYLCRHYILLSDTLGNMQVKLKFKDIESFTVREWFTE